MSKRLKSAEESARRERQAAKVAAYTLAADSAAPRDPKMRGDHYRSHLIDANRSIEILQTRIENLEAERDAIKHEADYRISISVGKTAAEQERLAAFKLAREKAAMLMETEHGEPTARSEAIRAIPDPKPKWS
ncbi:hypothetical protein [Rhizobium mayense]|uniref:hypothetical protein n=1 Tax=Rhizobium mayense TaxID=1312184 RepID=UPI00398C6253